MLSLYRRHRPRTFEQVVGQEHIVRTLRNAIELDKVHHAYLFVGSRGTGKTSMAKLLACALNAEGGPRPTSTRRRPPPRRSSAGTSLDVVEMDAASNNSVDDIRELRENVALAPMQGGKRVYILDEAHMLSRRGLERVPEDAGGAALARGVRARHHRGAQGARHDRGPLPPLRLPPPLAGADRGRARSRGRGGGHRAARRRRRHARARRHRQLPRRARHPRAARDLRRRGGQARGRDATSSAWPTPSWCSTPPSRSPTTTPRRRCSPSRALGLGPRHHPVHARPLRAPAPPVRRPDAGRGARLVLGHRRAHRAARVPGRARVRRASSCARSTSWPRRSRPSRTAPSRASSWRWRS